MSLRALGEASGDCIDCAQCVAVCPTGVDIREGANLGCIQCGLCIDACDSVMSKVGRPPRLIAYDTDVNIKRHASGLAPIYRNVRPRTLLYAGMIALVGGAMLLALIGRNAYSMAVIHDRNPLYVRLADGSLRNAFTVRFVNKQSDDRQFKLAVSGLDKASVEIIGSEQGSAGSDIVEVGPDQTREVRVLVSTKQPPSTESTPLVFSAIGEQGQTEAGARDFFHAP